MGSSTLAEVELFLDIFLNVVGAEIYFSEEDLEIHKFINQETSLNFSLNLVRPERYISKSFRKLQIF